jgi:hypothetical protein
LRAGEHRQRFVLDIAEVGFEDLPVAVDQPFQASSPCHSAAGRCSASRTASRSGQTRRSCAWRTQGTASNAARARSRSMLRMLPASRGAALARIVLTLLRCRSPSSWIMRMPNHGARASHSANAASTPIASSTSSAFAAAFISRMSAGSSVAACKVAIAQLPVRRAPSSVAAASSCRHSCS